MKDNILRILGFIAASAVLVIGLALLLARPVAPHPFFKPFTRYPLVIAHADDTGQSLWPGNTLMFLQGMADLGVDVLEMDVNMTRDGAIVLLHDRTVDRTTNGAGRVSDLTLAEIQALDAAYMWSQDGGQTFPHRGQGVVIPTLREVFERWPDYPMNIEIKQESPSLAEPLCALIRQYRRTESVLVASFSDTALREFRQACPSVATAPSTGEVTTFVVLNFAFLADTVSPAYHAFQVPLSRSNIPVVTPGFVQAAHRRNVQVQVWTINDPAEMQRLIDMGVDGIMTDRPDVLLRLLGR